MTPVAVGRGGGTGEITVFGLRGGAAGYYNIMHARVNIFPPKCRFGDDRQQVVTRQFVHAIIIIVMSCTYTRYIGTYIIIIIYTLRIVVRCCCIV